MAEIRCPHANADSIPGPDIHYVAPRRRDRGVEDSGWIESLLGRAAVGVLATVGGEYRPSLNPNLFVYDPDVQRLYLHTAKKGRTRDDLEKNPRVAFTVSEMGRLLPSDAAVNFSVEYASVILEGTGHLVEDKAEAERALRLFMAKYAPQFTYGEDYRGVSDRDLARTSVIEVRIESWSGKHKTSDAEDGYEFSPTRSLEQPTAEPRSGHA
ncbi:MAG: pyridoxamine 5'-phosphate oxidase family protein [Acidobacteriota bacterium]